MRLLGAGLVNRRYRILVLNDESIEYDLCAPLSRIISMSLFGRVRNKKKKWEQKFIVIQIISVFIQ